MPSDKEKYSTSFCKISESLRIGIGILILAITFRVLLWAQPDKPYFSSIESEEETLEEKIKNLKSIEREAYLARIEELTRQKIDQCIANARQKAIAYVDSLIMEEVLEKRREEGLIPFKPSRIDLDQADFSLDSIEVAPFVRDTTN